MWQVPESIDSRHQDSVVTALGAAPDVGSGPLSGWVMAAGTTDGQMLLFDARERGQQTVQRLKGHREHGQGVWVIDLYFTAVRGGGGGA